MKVAVIEAALEWAEAMNNLQSATVVGTIKGKRTLDPLWGRCPV